jgi:hypothetical protein
MLLKIFHFWKFFDLGRRPTRIRPPEKSCIFPYRQVTHYNETPFEKSYIFLPG